MKSETLHCSSTTRTNHLWSRCSKAQVDHCWDSRLTASPCSSCFQGLPRATWNPGDAWHPVAASSQSLSCLHGDSSWNNYINCDLHCWLSWGQAGSWDFFGLKRCTKQDLLGTNYRQEMWGGELVFFCSSHHRNKLLAQNLSDLDQSHTHWHFCSYFYMLRRYRKQMTRPVFI